MSAHLTSRLVAVANLVRTRHRLSGLFNSLFWRLSAFASVWAGVVLIAGAAGLTTLYRSAIERDLADTLDATIASLSPTIERADNQLARVGVQLPDPRYAETYSGRYWWVAMADTPQTPVDQSRSVWDQTFTVSASAIAQATADPSSISQFITDGPEDQRLQTHVRYLRMGSQTPGQGALIFVAVDRADVDRDIARFRNRVIWMLTLLAIALLAAVLILVRLGLRPLYHFGVAVGEIRAGERTDLERDAPAELLPLADELNALIAHNRKIVQHAQSRAGDLAHALKTPIAVLLSEAAGQNDALAAQVERQVAVMRSHVDRHLKSAGAAARARDLNARTVIRPVLDDLSRTVPKLYPDRETHITVDIQEPAPKAPRTAVPQGETPGALAVRAGREDVMDAVGNVVDNAVKWGQRHVVISARWNPPNTILISVEDDGPGLAPEQRDAVLQRGARLDEAVRGSGLGLAIVRDLVDAMGGELSLCESDLGGLRVCLTLPASLASPT